MKWLSELASSLRFLYRRPQEEQQLDEELQFHLERQIEQNLAECRPKKPGTQPCGCLEVCSRPERSALICVA